MNARVEVTPQVEAADLAGPAPGRARRKLARLALMASVPLVLAAAGAYFWLGSGRYLSTDNAYVQQTMASVSADVAGRIVEVDVRANQPVAAGDVLFRMDPAPFRIALDQANAALASARLQVEQLRATYATATARLSADRQTAAIRHRELDRSAELAGKGFTAASALDESRLNAQQADMQVALSEKALAAAAAALGGDVEAPVDRHPAVLVALAEKEKAELDLARTTVRAPEAGIASQVAKVTVGQYVAAGTPMLSIVKADDTWIEANFKETQLTDVVPGQPAEVVIDTYPGLTLHCSVESIGAATGSQFSLIPAQNATGNWVKVVQRIPVRVCVHDAGGAVLRAGMSAEVTIDTGKTLFQKVF